MLETTKEVSEEKKERARARAMARYYSGGKEKKSEYNKKMRESPEYKEKMKAYMLARRRNQWAKVKICELASRCKKRGIQFSLVEEDLVVPEYCPILGIKLEINTGRLADNSPSVDRIIPDLGYVKGNVVVVSQRANWLKKSATLSELISVVHFYLALSNEHKG